MKAAKPGDKPKINIEELATQRNESKTWLGDISLQVEALRTEITTRLQD
jgi:hypothetical protein